MWITLLSGWVMGEIVVVGGGGHGKVLISLLKKKTGCRILGYVDPHDRGTVLAVPWLGDDAVLPVLLRRHSQCQAAIGVGRVDASSKRGYGLLARLEEMGFIVPAIVSPTAVVNEDVVLGAGSVVFDGAVVNSGTVTGRGCIMNTNCTVEHDCFLGYNVHIAPGSVLSGGVILGDNCMVGVGATIVQGVRIVADCLVGAGAVVVKDLDEPGMYVGNPARKLP
jgi:sugar O-acyltransferase (sialic acid O-acetyltransferase NeuD family)